MRFGVLGQMEIVDDGGRRIRIAAPRQRVLLAALLLNANRVVNVDVLAETVWDGMPPPGAANTLRAYVMRLRRALGHAAVRLETRAPGYLIRVAPGEFDAATFEELCRRVGAAVRAGDRWQSAHSEAVWALDLWREEPLVDVPSTTLRDAWVPRLEEQHLQLTEWWIEAEMQLGTSQTLLPRLGGLVRQHPLREPLYRLQMLALARSDRSGEALAVYRHARSVLIEQLGIEPGPGLRQLQQRILGGDFSLC